MQKTIAAIEQEGVSLRQAAEIYEIRIPWSTLHVHVTGQVEHGQCFTQTMQAPI